MSRCSEARLLPLPSLLPNHIRATLLSHPNFVYLPGGDVNSSPWAKRLLLVRSVLRIAYSEVAGEDEVRR